MNIQYCDLQILHTFHWLNDLWYDHFGIQSVEVWGCVRERVAKVFTHLNYTIDLRVFRTLVTCS